MSHARWILATIDCMAFIYVLCLFDSIRAYLKLFDKILSQILASDNILSLLCIKQSGKRFSQIENEKNMKFDAKNFDERKVARYFVMSGNDITGDSWLHEPFLMLIQGKEVSLGWLATESSELEFEVRHFIMLSNQCGGMRFGNQNLSGVQKFLLHYLEKIGAIRILKKEIKKIANRFGDYNECIENTYYETV